MRLKYTKNLITNGDASGLDGWAGTGLLEKDTFKITANRSLTQTVSLSNQATVVKFSFDYLPDSDTAEQEPGTDVTLKLEYADDKMTSVWLPT